MLLPSLTSISTIFRVPLAPMMSKIFLIHPLEVQSEIIKRITDYWQHGYGKTYNPDRSNALERVTYTSSIESAIAAVTEIEGQAPVTITTDARTYPNTVTYGFVRKLLHSGDKPLLLLLAPALVWNRKQ